MHVIWPLAVVPTCVVHLVRDSLRYSAKQHWQTITRQLRGIYTSATVEEATDRFEEFADPSYAPFANGTPVRAAFTEARYQPELQLFD